MNQEPDRSGGAPGGPGSEKELDAILEEAASLVRKISGELGSPPTPATPERAKDSAVAPSKNLDAELAALDELVASTAAQIDETPPSTVSRDAPANRAENIAAVPPSQPKKPVAPTTIPDFMREFTGPDSQPEAATPVKPSSPAPPPAAPKAPMVESPSASRAVAPSRPGVVGTGMLGVVDKPAQSPLPPLQISDRAVPPGESSQPTSPMSDEEEAILQPPARRSLSHALLPILGALVGLLEIADRPLRFIGERPRRLLGRVALATIGTALVLFVLSLARR